MTDPELTKDIHDMRQVQEVAYRLRDTLVAGNLDNSFLECAALFIACMSVQQARPEAALDALAKMAKDLLPMAARAYAEERETNVSIQEILAKLFY